MSGDGIIKQEEPSLTQQWNASALTSNSWYSNPLNIEYNQRFRGYITRVPICLRHWIPHFRSTPPAPAPSTPGTGLALAWHRAGRAAVEKLQGGPACNIYRPKEGNPIIPHLSSSFTIFALKASLHGEKHATKNPVQIQCTECGVKLSPQNRRDVAPPFSAIVMICATESAILRLGMGQSQVASNWKSVDTKA